MIYAAVALLVIVLWGTVGYMSLEKYTLVEALYMTIITIATIGFMEVHPLHEMGRIFTIFLAFAGTGLMLLYVGILTQFIVEGQLSRFFGRRRVERAVTNLKKHYILCGAGRIGSLVAIELKNRKVPFVIVERDEKEAENLVEAGYLVINGDAGEEETLKRAQIKGAKGMVLALASDAETVYAILTARQLNPDLFIIARANDVGSEKKINMAGANRIVSPYQTVSHRMINAIIRPEVVDMLELAFLDKNLDLALEGVAVTRESAFAGRSIMESNIRADFGVNVIGIKKADGETVLGPGPQDLIEAGDVLIVAGRRTDVEKLADTARG